MDTEFPYLNRELSWLDFNLRVLAMAGDENVPLLERAKFLAIHSGNLDEFFQVRVAGLKNLIESGIARRTPDGLSPTAQLAGIREAVIRQYDLVDEIFHDELVPELSAVGITFSDWASLDEDDKLYLDDMFHDRIFPVLTPLAVDPAHPFPYISDKSLNLAVFLRHPDGGSQQFARVKVPPILPRFAVMPDGERFVPLEQVIARHLGRLFPGMAAVTHCPFRVTRDADLSIDDDQGGDVMQAVESQLAQLRFGEPVRLEIENHVDDEMRTFLTRELELEDDDVYPARGPLDLKGLWSLYGLDRPELKFHPHTPQTPPAFARARAAGRSVFAMLREHDVLVHHPYESFAASVEEFISRAARDPQVLAIKMTMYRTSPDSPILRSLIHAAESGKQVVVLLELKARFDEKANIEWARLLERAGVHVAYGLVGLKTHTKTALVVRQEGETIRRYGHIGTGNYNSETARIYEDVGLFTADDEVGADLSELFNGLTGYSARQDFQKLVVAPHSLRDSILELIDIESQHTDGHIVMKMNSLVDADVIEALYEASGRGTQIDLIVRGICCLVPGVEGISENITVRSIVGRYLEHSRIYRFGNDARGHTYLIGSADMMPRNLDFRVEALAPVTQQHHTERLDRAIELYLADDQLAWELDEGGNWWRLDGPDEIDVHELLEAGAEAPSIPPSEMPTATVGGPDDAWDPTQPVRPTIGSAVVADARGDAVHDEDPAHRRSTDRHLPDQNGEQGDEPDDVAALLEDLASDTDPDSQVDEPTRSEGLGITSASSASLAGWPANTRTRPVTGPGTARAAGQPTRALRSTGTDTADAGPSAANAAGNGEDVVAGGTRGEPQPSDLTDDEIEDADTRWSDG